MDLLCDALSFLEKCEEKTERAPLRPEAPQSAQNHQTRLARPQPQPSQQLLRVVSHDHRKPSEDDLPAEDYDHYLQSNLLKDSPIWAAEQALDKYIAAHKLKLVTADQIPVVPPGYIEAKDIREWDVFLGRGGKTNKQNQNYRTFVKICRKAYVSAKRKHKPLVAEVIVERIRRLGGRFLKKEGNHWVDVQDRKAREKTSQALREGAPDMRTDATDRVTEVKLPKRSRRERMPRRVTDVLDWDTVSLEHKIAGGETQPPVTDEDSSGSSGTETPSKRQRVL